MGTTSSLGFCCEVVKEEGEVVARQAVVVVVNDKKEVEVVLGQRQAEPDNRLAPANVGVDDDVGGGLVAKVVAWRAREGHVEEAKTSALNPGRTTRYPGVVDTTDPPPRALFIVAIDRIPFSRSLSHVQVAHQAHSEGDWLGNVTPASLNESERQRQLM